MDSGGKDQFEKILGALLIVKAIEHAERGHICTQRPRVADLKYLDSWRFESFSVGCGPGGADTGVLLSKDKNSILYEAKTAPYKAEGGRQEWNTVSIYRTRHFEANLASKWPWNWNLVDMSTPSIPTLSEFFWVFKTRTYEQRHFFIGKRTNLCVCGVNLD